MGSGPLVVANGGVGAPGGSPDPTEIRMETGGKFGMSLTIR